MKNGVYKRKSFAVLIVVIADPGSIWMCVFVCTTSKKQTKKKKIRL